MRADASILVVDDDTESLELLTTTLVAEGYDVRPADSGKLALASAAARLPQLILLDIRMPDIDGFEVCRRLRTADRWAPVVMLTARDAVRDRVAGLDAGADDYLTKPFSFGELFARLRALLRRGAAERPPVLRVGDLTLDPAEHRVARGDIEVRLTAKEFALLEYLMRRAGEVLSRTRLIEHVWDFGYDGDSNVVDVYVRYLRDKIDRPFGRSSIETIRGSGYRLRTDAGA